MEEKLILLVEDDPDDEILTLRALRKTQVRHEVVVAHDGAEALDYLFAGGGYAGQCPARLPDLVLLDLKLPKVDGREVVRRLRADQRTRPLPVVMFTSSRERRDILDSYCCGANSYVHKPVDFAQLLEAIRQLALYWLDLNEEPPEG